MKVTANTTILYFVSPDVTNVEVVITNKQTKKVVYNGVLTVNQIGFYNSITEPNFNFAKNQTYTLSVFKNTISDLADRVDKTNGTLEAKNCLLQDLKMFNFVQSVLIYRATIYSDVTDNYSVSNKINSTDEYITIK